MVQRKDGFFGCVGVLGLEDSQRTVGFSLHFLVSHFMDFILRGCSISVRIDHRLEAASCRNAFLILQQ